MARPTLLVVDDDEAVLEFLRAKLGARYDIVPTIDPGSVLDLAQRYRPDLVLCDLDMPDMDGSDVSRVLAADPQVGGTPLLFLTALALPEELERLAGTLGGRPAISKSEPLERLVARIESLIK